MIRLPALLVMAVLLSCGNNHLIVDRSYRETVEADYGRRISMFAPEVTPLFSLADTIRNKQLREAVEFLLAYMPLSDIAVYDPGFLLANANAALSAREEMPWGDSIPSEIFLHFVLPPRVNTENPDSFRLLYYDELKERTKGLDATQAALEINRWCHEKVSYQPSDSRTSSPIATILSARGRCGEESTLVVAALRTVGLPARQVYTPRWAHTDDNHAWVEFWSNGSWHYMGACEPEPVPDRGWFTEPARRAMLIHTRAFGRYSGNEPLVRSERMFSEINTLDRYAPVKDLVVTVTDTAGVPVPGAWVSYLLYNYAELYPLARLRCDEQGRSSFSTGKGSLLVWADDGTRYGFSLASPTDTLLEIIIASYYPEATYDLDLEAPPVLPTLPGIDKKMADENNLRLKHEDSIRQAYIDSWMTGTDVGEIAAAGGVPKERIEPLLRRSMGNYKSIESFINTSGSRAATAVRILENISEKDLRDTPVSVLTDHLENAPERPSDMDEKLYDEFVMSPRIDNELLTPFRSSLKYMPEELMSSFITDPRNIAAWVDTAISITDTENYYGTPVVPAGVERLRMADRHSRDIFFVALCRTAGHPARLAPDTGRPQYYSSGGWNDVWFTGDTKPSGERACVTFISSETNPVPEYHVNFTIAVLEDGRYKTFDFGYGVRISDLPEKITLYPGRYMLTTGNREENGNVLANITFFDLLPGENTEIDIRLRHPGEKITERGKIDMENELLSYNGDKIKLGTISEKGLVCIWIEPGKEPTRHILNDLPQLKKDYDRWGGKFIFLTDPERAADSFKPGDIAGLPANSVFVSDDSLKFMRSVFKGNPEDHPMPLVLCCDNEGNIIFSSEGYNIGTGAQILKNIR